MSLTSYQTAPPRDKRLIYSIKVYFFYLLYLLVILNLFLFVNSIFFSYVSLISCNDLFIKVYKNKIFSYKTVPGDYCKGVTPDPIPNSAVKPFSANGTLS